MQDEMRGLLCGTSVDTPYEIDETASEESDLEITSREKPMEKRSDSEKIVMPGAVECRICTTLHTPPIPVCCDSCGNVLQPEKLPKEKVWKCTNTTCSGTDLGYLNFSDVGRCGLCGAKREDTR